VDEQRRVRLGERVEQVAAAVEPAVRGQRLAGDRDAREAVADQPGDRPRAGIGRVQRHRGERGQPAAGPVDGVGDALVVGIEQRRCLIRGQRLDPDRRRQRDDGAVDRYLVQRGDPGFHPLRGEIERERLLVLDAHQVAVQAGRLRAPPHRLDERVRPQVLMKIDAHAGNGGESFNMPL
jgi:hypothetical protein